MKNVLGIVLVGMLLGCIVTKDMRLEGKYDPRTRVFAARDSVYWVGWPEDGVLRISRDGYVGLMDTAGTILCEPRYDKVFAFDEGLAVVSRDNRYGIIDRGGREILKPSLPYISDFMEEVAWFLDAGLQLWGLLDREGRVVKAAECSTIRRHQGREIYWNGIQKALINPDGKEIFKLDLARFNPLQGERAYFMRNAEFIRQGGVESFLNEKRERKSAGIPFAERHQNDIVLFFAEGRAIYPEKMNGAVKLGYIDTEGHVVIPAQYDNAQLFAGEIACVKNNGKWGAINRAGREVAPFRYTYLAYAPSGHFIFQEGAGYGVMSLEGKVLVPAEYLAVKHLYSQVFGLLKATDGMEGGAYAVEGQDLPISMAMRGWGAIDVRTLKTVLPFEYHAVKTMNGELGVGLVYAFDEISVQKGANVFPPGVTNMPTDKTYEGKVTAQVFNAETLLGRYESESMLIQDQSAPKPAHFEMIVPYRQWEGYFIFKAAILKRDGQEVRDEADLRNIKAWMNPAKATLFQDDHSAKTGVKNLQGEIVVPADFDSIMIGSAGFIVKKDEKYGYLDFRGIEVLPLTYTAMEETASGALKVTLGQVTHLIDKGGNKIVER
jgi:hypothetical protein